MGKTGKQGRSHIVPSQGKSIQHKFRLNESSFNWSFRQAFWNHEGWRDCGDIKSFVNDIINKLQDYETQTWQNVQDANGGKSVGHGTNSHFISAAELPRDEKKEYIRCGYMEKYDKVFSLRLSALERLIGIVDMNRFYILWYDAKHKFF